jgi:hypothetical protein
MASGMPKTIVLTIRIEGTLAPHFVEVTDSDLERIEVL